MHLQDFCRLATRQNAETVEAVENMLANQRSIDMRVRSMLLSRHCSSELILGLLLEKGYMGELE